MSELAELQEEGPAAGGTKVEFVLPLAIQMYPHTKLRDENKLVGVFDEELARLAEAMFKIMYETDGVGLAAPRGQNTWAPPQASWVAATDAGGQK